jgi:phenylacetate-CoA ligase
MLKVKGVMVYPLSVETVIQSFAPRVTGQFRIVLSEPPPRVVPPMRLRIEHSPDVAGGGLRGLEAELVEEMHRRLKIRPAIEWVRPHTLQRSMKKTQLLENEYPR